MLDVFDRLPDGLLDLESDQIYKILERPTLIHLEGDRQAPLFVSVLLHGNETTSWLAIRELLRKYEAQRLPRSLSIFIGNVSAARYRLRHLPNQPDYNRIWQTGNTPEHHMAQQVIEEMRSRGVFASIDVHNNTGRNPHYGCITHLEKDFRKLARLFGKTVVYYTSPKTVQSFAFGHFCPSIVVECGQPDVPDGTVHALEFMETCLNLDSFDSLPDSLIADIDLFHTVAIVKVPEEINFSFEGNPNDDITFPAEMDCLNFCELPIGANFGKTKNESAYLSALSEDGEEKGDRYFQIENGEIKLKIAAMPSMLTLDTDIIRQDCLCYLMERLPLKTK
ncbi:M14 family metallopeptidase [Pseudanabaena sp. ABRG5-3]|uniref:M14 family metallopeptidase n=1 Tax=Pseudanabaena sp. ABRG5-3 TaxID=685565 RepID=UPI000DC6F5D9|nr:M14 family metallopeptidase [Pseudanabaena sp. ABRG5-3]BBC25955.1 succinylglutamate desuccinylase/aspartoacylase [Pseudanabaena sp. ABRG5-3]